MAHNVQLWTADFAANLYDSTAFWTIARNHSGYVNGNIVHIPNAATATPGGVLTNGTVLPVASTRKTFADVTYSPVTLYAGPVHVTNIDAAEASFETRTATMEDMKNYMVSQIGKFIAIAWAPAVTSTGSIVDTTGVATRGNIFGNAAIKKITMADLLSARVKLEQSSKRGDDLFLIVDPFQYADIVELAGAAFIPVPAEKALVSAFVGEYAGFKIVKRYEGIGYTAAKAAKVAFGAAAQATDLSAALAVSASFLSFAIADIKLDVKEFETGYFADVMQAALRCGASPMYPVAANIQPGVVAIIESK